MGDEAAVILEDTGEQISGTVTVVSSMEETLSGGRLVKNVTVEVSNPGGLTTDTAASVTVDGFVCSAEEHSKRKRRQLSAWSSPETRVSRSRIF